VADDALESEALVEPLLELAILGRTGSPLEMELHPLPQFLHLDRFGEVVVSTFLKRRDRVLHVREGGDQEEGKIRPLCRTWRRSSYPSMPGIRTSETTHVHRSRRELDDLEGLLGLRERRVRIPDPVQGPGHGLDGSRRRRR
jgi:hypothetical protein